MTLVNVNVPPPVAADQLPVIFEVALKFNCSFDPAPASTAVTLSTTTDSGSPMVIDPFTVSAESPSLNSIRFPPLPNVGASLTAVILIVDAPGLDSVPSELSTTFQLIVRAVASGVSVVLLNLTDRNAS